MKTCRKCERILPVEAFKQWNSRCCLECDPRIHSPWNYKARTPRKRSGKKKVTKGIYIPLKTEKQRLRKIKKRKAKKGNPFSKLWHPSYPTIPYSEFLNTPYWKAISNHKKNLAGHKCEKCGSDKYLQCHHVHYILRGVEHKDLSCLMVLCGACHRDEHGL